MNLKIALISFAAAICILMNGHAAAAQEDLKEHRSCNYCGMDRKAYGFSRMLIHYEDGGAVGVCSLHCAVVEMNANPGRKVKSLFVADRDSRSLIDAEQAVWVLGGSKRGVMTEQPKWAFQTRSAADAFIKDFGGTIVGWKEALTAAQEELIKATRGS